jgi:hypothetical protein
VGIDGVLEGFCPPFKSLEQAVDEIATLKWGPEGIYGKKGYDLPRPGFYDSITDVVKAYCTYVYETYGRFPKYSDAMFVPILAQIHHLDMSFYQTLLPEYLNDADSKHVSEWHGEPKS